MLNICIIRTLAQGKLKGSIYIYNLVPPSHLLWKSWLGGSNPWALTVDKPGKGQVFTTNHGIETRYSSVFKRFLRTHTHVLFWGHWYPCFGFLVTSPLGFKVRVGSALFAFAEVNVMYIPKDPSLVLYLPTSWRPTLQPVTSPHSLAEVMLAWIWRTTVRQLDNTKQDKGFFLELSAQDRSPFCIFNILNEILQHPELKDTFLVGNHCHIFSEDYHIKCSQHFKKHKQILPKNYSKKWLQNGPLSCYVF